MASPARDASPTECGIHDGLTKADVMRPPLDACDPVTNSSCADPRRELVATGPCSPRHQGVVKTSEITRRQ